ncbi:MFS transporter [Salipaludibacillus sp. CF4.18]|uniref:MFS transporter n=1 Tax=Salipaludibacillus sp. CF4.18 TaxID=3373081 RepID=UPI003EE7CD38
MQTSKQPIWTRDFLSISFVNFIVFVIFYTLLTTLPLYVIYDLEGTAAQGGLVVTVMLLSAIISRPFSGIILERIGKRRVLVASMFIFTVTTFGYLWIDQFTALLVLRFLHGLSFGILTTATTAIATNLVPIKRQGEGLGYYMMSMNLAVVVGPFFGLTLIQFGSFHQLFFVLNIFIMIGLLCAIFVKVTDISTKTLQPMKSKISIHHFFELKAMPIALTGSLVAFAYSGIISFISVYATEIGLAKISSYFFLVFAVTMLATRPYIGRVFDQRGPKFVILPCLVLFAIGLVILSIADSAFLFLVSAGLIGIGYGSLLPFFLSLSVKFAPPGRNSHATATFFTFYDSGIAAGSFLLGIIVSFTGFSLLFTYSAVLVLITTVGFYFLINHLQTSTKKNA